MEPLTLGLAVSSLLGPLLGALGGFWSGRWASRDSYSDLVLQFEKDRLAGAIMRDQVDELLERITQERKRIIGERSQIRAKQAAADVVDPAAIIPTTDGRDAQIEAVRARYEPGHH